MKYTVIEEMVFSANGAIASSNTARLPPKSNVIIVVLIENDKLLFFSPLRAYLTPSIDR